MFFDCKYAEKLYYTQSCKWKKVKSLLYPYRNTKYPKPKPPDTKSTLIIGTRKSISTLLLSKEFEQQQTGSDHAV